MVTYAGATESSGEGGAASVTLVIARQAEDVGQIAGTWTLIKPDMKRSAWTDDYSNILEGIRDAWIGPKVDEVLIKPVQSADARN